MKENKIDVSDKIVMRDIDTITPYDKNPRKNDKTVEELVKIIPKVGFNVPLVIDKDGVIVKGHARFKAAQTLGMKQLPCIVTDADPEAIKADRITDNRISELSEWVNQELNHEVDMIDLDIDFDGLGLPKPSYEDMPPLDFDNDIEDDEPMISPEKKEKMYQDFLAKQSEISEKKAQITTEEKLEKAEKEQAEIPVKRKYYKIKCEQCGNDLWVEVGKTYTI